MDYTGIWQYQELTNYVSKSKSRWAYCRDLERGHGYNHDWAAYQTKSRRLAPKELLLWSEE